MRSCGPRPGTPGQPSGRVLEPHRVNTLCCSACQPPLVAKAAFPRGSAVKAGEPCRGLARGREPESLPVGYLGPRQERGNLRVPRGVRLRSPAHRVGRCPPPPGRGGGDVRPVAPASKPEPDRTSHHAAPYDPARIVQRDEGVGGRIHQRLGAVGRTVGHPSPAAWTAAAAGAAKPGASSSPSASRSMCRASSRAASSRASVVFPLPAQPTTTTRSGIGRSGTGRAAMPMTVRREGQAPTAGRQPGMRLARIGASSLCPALWHVRELVG
jgi:hypothetical protein